MSELAERLMMLTAGKALQMDSAGGNGGIPEWTPQDAAQACGGLDRRRYAAFAVRWAADRSLDSTLFGALMNESSAMAMRERWPSRTRCGKSYLEKLVQLAVFEEHTPPGLVIARMTLQQRQTVFGQDPEAIQELIRDGMTARIRPLLFAHLAEVPVPTWVHELARPYQGVRDILDSWCDDARRHVMRRVRATEAEASALD